MGVREEGECVFVISPCIQLPIMQCTDFVNKYGKEVVQLIDQAIDPEKICEVSSS